MAHIASGGIISFNTQPPEGGWGLFWWSDVADKVSTRSRLKAAGRSKRMGLRFLTVSTHSRLKAAGLGSGYGIDLYSVSTHSRPKAAGTAALPHISGTACFNTQPPEGGWAPKAAAKNMAFKVSTHNRPKAAGTYRRAGGRYWRSFNTQPPEGGWYTASCF